MRKWDTIQFGKFGKFGSHACILMLITSAAKQPHIRPLTDWLPIFVYWLFKTSTEFWDINIYGIE